MDSLNLTDDPISICKGNLPKDLLEMTSAEREAYYIDVQQRTRQYLFSIGMPVVIREAGHTMVE
jgi:hypothetical protein